MRTSANLKNLQNDNVYIDTQLVSLSKLTNTNTRRGLDKALISNGKIVNIVSNEYGHLSNENFFLKVEEALINANIHYDMRSINRDDRTFAVDFILNDDSLHINIKNKTKDNIRPMLRFVNSYDGSCKTSGSFGYFREICTNGLHISETKLEFSVRKKGNVESILLPKIDDLVDKFINNEYYSIHRKFEVLAETPIKDLNKFVEVTATDLKIFQYAKSQKNPDPSLNARLVLETIRKEADALGSSPNIWLGYNAFNELIHGKLKKNFTQQKDMDKKVFNYLYDSIEN